MTTQNTLLAHIVPLYGKTELVATEALRYILQQSEAARKALESMMVTAGVEVDSLARFETEVSGEDGERVDLVCYDEHGTKRVLIEAKFWAGLTDNQPNTYLASLPEDTHSALLFVAPAQRIETLWPELCRRAEEQHTLRVTSDTQTSGELRGVSIDSNGHKMLLTSWRAVLERMESQASIAGDASTVRDIEQLRGLTERMDSDAFLPIHSDELGQDFPFRMIGFANLVHQAAQRAIGEGWADSQGLRITPQWYGDGRRIRFHGVEVWFGINMEQWAINGQTPLWLQARGADEWHSITVPTSVEHPEVLDAVVKQLDTIGKRLKSERGNQ